MKFGDKNYVIGVTYRDQIDSNGDAVATWDFAMVFDDKQRVMVDLELMVTLEQRSQLVIKSSDHNSSVLLSRTIQVLLH
ncbi:MAG: hypothetical protein CM15mV3_0460 [Caudoviricetes sp.]|nr:MAG: hypothetical protein CM15mV3_0460 [Caudoviricetes sp.]